MEEQILRSIKKYIPDLVDLVLKVRPDADRGSVEASAAVMLLIATIYMLNMIPRSSRIEAAIDALADRLPQSLEDRPVNLSHAILDPQILTQASKIINGAYHTNLLGAFDAIYNARISSDFARMGSMVNGPLGELGGVCVVTGEALFGISKMARWMEGFDGPLGGPGGDYVMGLLSIYRKHFSNVVNAVTGSSHSHSGSGSGSNAGSKACFVATACFASPHQQTVVTLRRFREVVLKKHTFGRSLVKNYYRISPPLAEAIRRYPVLRHPITIALALLAGLLSRCFRLD